MSPCNRARLASCPHFLFISFLDDVGWNSKREKQGQVSTASCRIAVADVRTIRVAHYPSVNLIYLSDFYLRQSVHFFYPA